MEKRTIVVIHEVGAGAKVVKKPDDPFALVEDFSSPEISWSGKLFQKLSQKASKKHHNLFLFGHYTLKNLQLELQRLLRQFILEIFFHQSLIHCFLFRTC